MTYHSLYSLIVGAFPKVFVCHFDLGIGSLRSIQIAKLQENELNEGISKNSFKVLF